MLVAALFVALSVSVAVSGRVWAAVAADADTIFVTKNRPYVFQGWGTSLAWWGNVVGENYDPATGVGWSDFSRRYIDSALFDAPDPSQPDLPRLGLNVVRYNAGASPTRAGLNQLPAFCQNFRAGGAVPTVVPTDGTGVNLSLDPQIPILHDAQQRIAQGGSRPVLEAFANSPPWWMTINHCPMGRLGLISDPVDNLDPSRYGDYDKYLLNVLQALRAEGITFDTVEPFNEPGSDNGLRDIRWGRCNHDPDPIKSDCQEGAHYNRSTQNSIIGMLCDSLQFAGFNTQVSAPDGNSPDETIDAYTSYEDPRKRCLAQVNTHSYQNGAAAYVGNRRAELYADTHPLNNPSQPTTPISMSEFGTGGLGENMASALTLARQIATDIKYLRPRTWVYWQSVEVRSPGAWGLLEAPNWPREVPTGLTPPNVPDFTKRYYALSQFSRFIRPGYTILDAIDPKDTAEPNPEKALSVAAMAPDGKKVVIVSTNDSGDPRPVTYDLNALGVGIESVAAYRTSDTGSVGTGNLIPVAPTTIATTSLGDTLPARTITTYVINNPSPGLPGTGQPPFNQPPTVSAGRDVTGNETQPVTLSGIVADPDDTPAIRWSWQAGPGTDPGATCAFADPHAPLTTVTCSDEGTYRLTLTADDGINAPVSSSIMATLANLGPSISIASPTAWQTIQGPVTIGLSAPVVDPGAHDTHTCTINWDDGSPPETFAQERSCDRSHLFAHPGMYTITATVTDDDQHSASADVIAVVFDPAAGRVTGGGWIDSPLGAYVPDPSIAGKAHFNVNVRYTAGSTVPTGHLDFRLQDAKIRLTVSGLDWLVVSPDGEMAVKGTGSFGGQDVRFVFYGYQGCGGNPATGCQNGPDRFRALIWPSVQGPVPGSPLIYDDVPGVDLELADANPQPLGGGNIQIHR